MQFSIALFPRFFHGHIPLFTEQYLHEFFTTPKIMNIQTGVIMLVIKPSKVWSVCNFNENK